MTLPALKPDYDTLVAAWCELAAAGTVALQTVRAGETELLHACIDRSHASLVVISAGVHGDEPAGPSALLELVREGLPAQFAYELWPCTNPTGYRLGTRQNAQGVDINRAYGDGRTAESAAVAACWPSRVPILTLDLHEDFEAAGFYCYERAVHGRFRAPELIARLERAGIPIQDDLNGIDLGMPSEEAERRGLWYVERGWIRVLGHDPEWARDGRPFSAWVTEQGVSHALTLEAPRLAPWELRVRSLVLAVRTALGLVKAPSEE